LFFSIVLFFDHFFGLIKFVIDILSHLAISTEVQDAQQQKGKGTTTKQ